MSIRWTPALSLGHPEIDAQHQELFRRAAKLLEAMLTGDRTAIAQLFDFLGSYVVDHFAEEERLMQESRFPGYTVHKAAHERFVRDYQALRKLHDESGASAAVAIKARSWLGEWLQNHIASTDQLLARHLLRSTG
ncbi:MAG TPA: bacteriohemerythrin [Anaeromyxobacter sp.]|nr:bacteriohemerythrin [Anaeromyxobacter sp.]